MPLYAFSPCAFVIVWSRVLTTT